MKYLYQHTNWTSFQWNSKPFEAVLSNIHYLQELLIGKMNALGSLFQKEALLNTLTLDVLKSSEIEGEKLNRAAVRSSIARKLGIDVAGLAYSDRDVDGVVDMMLDTTQSYLQPVTEERLFAWHGALFPTGKSGLYSIEVARYRTGEMQVVSGAMGNEKVHYEAVPAKDVKQEMDKLLLYINTNSSTDSILKAAIVHLWFVTIHPFDDGNGRIARAITDLLLARSDGSKLRFYSMSNQILKERKRYYEALEKAQHADSSDITSYLLWFTKCLEKALLNSDTILRNTIQKAQFWQANVQTPLNERQKTMVNRLFDGFVGNLTSQKWAKITKTSPDTALRDIKDLMAKGILV